MRLKEELKSSKLLVVSFMYHRKTVNHNFSVINFGNFIIFCFSNLACLTLFYWMIFQMVQNFFPENFACNTICERKEAWGEVLRSRDIVVIVMTKYGSYELGPNWDHSKQAPRFMVMES